jgi:hypothetical protein
MKQLNLQNEPIVRNRNFLLKMYLSDRINNAKRWIDYLDCSVSFARQLDKKTKILDILDLVKKPFYATLQFNFENGRENVIRYCMSVTDYRTNKPSGIERFAWMICPNSEHNLTEIIDIYKRVFKKNI